MNDSRVLDLGCGRGGDMKKHFKNQVSYYYGIDISENSIDEARERYERMSTTEGRYKRGHPHRGDDSQIKQHIATFGVVDAYNHPFDLQMKFNIISCQFSLHYAFASKEIFETSIRNIVNHIAEDGIFLATIPNSNTIMRRYKKYGNRYGNDYYKIIFKESYESIVNRDSKFGIEYTFELKEAIDTCVEYLVDYKLLVDAFKAYNFEFCEFKDFVTFFNKNYKKHEDLYLMQMKNRLNEEELKVVELYSVIVFRKKQEPKIIEENVEYTKDI